MINFLVNKPLILIIKIYSNFISILLPDACRFTPTCSNYALESIKKHKLIYALSLIIRRLFSCHPFNKNTGYDPVP